MRRTISSRAHLLSNPKCALPEEGEDICSSAQKDGEMRIGSVLRHADVSFNRIRRIGDLSWHKRLISLDLSHNKISKIEGISSLFVLRELDLSHNKISILQGLPPRLHKLTIDNNSIRNPSHASTLAELCILVGQGKLR